MELEAEMSQYLYGLLWVMHMVVGVGTTVDTTTLGETILACGGLLFGMMMNIGIIAAAGSALNALGQREQEKRMRTHSPTHACMHTCTTTRTSMSMLRCLRACPAAHLIHNRNCM